jgi:glyoxylase-like metal-dependent hydrolase (beta-lactamase superfamily II)
VRPQVVTLTNGGFAENCYLVADPDRGEAAIVDPGEEAQLFRARLRHEGWTLKAIWLTHAHLDHVAGVAALREGSEVPIFLHPADRPLYDRVAMQAAQFGLEVTPPPPPDRELADGGSVSVGDCTFTVVHTPGHTPGGVCLLGHGLAFVGDTLFAGSIGRTDLPGGDLKALLASIHQRLLTLPDETVVHSGHGPATTIGAEKKDNPFVKLVPGVNACLKCGYPVKGRPWGCKNPCPNCGHVYPLGDCSD